jgi:hypothetical protein
MPSSTRGCETLRLNASLCAARTRGGGVALPFNLLLIEPRHLRSDTSRLGDLYAIASGHHAKDAAMDLMISSNLSKSTLLHTSKSFDYTLRLAENT